MQFNTETTSTLTTQETKEKEDAHPSTDTATDAKQPMNKMGPHPQIKAQRNFFT